MDDVLNKPLSLKEIKKLTNNGSLYLTGKVSLELTDLYDGYESFLSALSFKLVGNDLLMDITYSVIGGEGESVFFEVSGDVREVISSL